MSGKQAKHTDMEREERSIVVAAILRRTSSMY